MKKCNSCHIEKTIDNFGIDNRAKDKKANCCKKCDNHKTKMFRRTKKGLISKIYGNQRQSSKYREMAFPTYTKKWLENWLMINPEFHRLYDVWVLSKYDKIMVPSVDRINDYVGYTEYNIQLTIWKLNKDRSHLDMKKGINTKSCIGVVIIDDNDNIISTFYSMHQASRITKVKQGHISECCNGKRKKAGGFVWRKKDA